MDPLSEAIAVLDARRGLFSRLEAGGAWAIDFDGYMNAKFGAILRGSCWLLVDGSDKPIRLLENDCYVVGNERKYRLFSSVGAPVAQANEVFTRMTNGTTHWGTGTDTVIVGGRVDLDEIDSAALSRILPPVVHVSAGSEPAKVLHAVLRLLDHETSLPRFGTTLVIERLAHVAFVQLLRAYAATHHEAANRSLVALGDPQVGAALTLMHQDPARRWTVEELAATVHMSRSRFAARFTELVGNPPLQYLLIWRMRTASRELRSTNKSVSEIAAALGYQSDSAFSNAFKRVIGHSPIDHRHRHPTQPAVGLGNVVQPD